MPISTLALVLIQIGLALLQRLLAPRLQRRKSAPFEAPTTEDGAYITKGYGVFQVAGVVTVVREGEKQDQGADGSVTFYFAKMQMGLGWGPIDVLYDIISDERSLKLQLPNRLQSLDGGDPLVTDPPLRTLLTSGIPLTGDAPLVLDVAARQMYGGQLQEGGLQGQIRLYRGTNGQPIDPLSIVDAGADASALPHLAYAMFGVAVGEPTTSQLVDKFYFIANSATPKPISFLLGAYPNALLGDDGRIGLNANPAEMIYELSTNAVWGKGEPTGTFDTAQWEAKALQLKAEGCGLSGLFSGRTLDDIKDDILSHIDGELVTDPITGLVQLKLARADYEVEDLMEINSNNSENFRQGEAQFAQTLNEIKIKYQRFEGGSTGPQTATFTPVFGAGGKPFGQSIFVWESASRNLSGISATRDRLGVIVTLDRTETPAGGGDYYVNPVTGEFRFFHRNDNSTQLQNGDVISVAFTAAPTFSGFVDATATAQNQANRQILGRLRSEAYDYPLYTTPGLAQKKADLLLRTTSRKLAVFQWTMGRAGAHLTAMDVVRINDPVKYRLADFPARITKVTIGTLEHPETTFEGVEDVFGQQALGAFNQQSVQGPPTPTTQAPAMAISCGAGETVVRINLFASDPIFDIEIWEADDELGTGAVLLGTVPGPTPFYDVGTDETKAHRVRQVMDGMLPGPYTNWITCALAEPPVVDPGCVLPVWDELVDQAVGSLELLFADVQDRLRTVAFATQSGLGALSAYVIDTTAPYSTTVALVDGRSSLIRYRITFQDCDGTTATRDGVVDFPAFTPEPPLVTGDATGGPIDLDIHASLVDGSRTPIGVDWTSFGKASYTRIDASRSSRCRIVSFTTKESLPAGAKVALQYVPFDNTNPAEGDWGWLADEDENGPEQPSVAVDAETPLPLASAHFSLALGARQDMTIRLVGKGGDGTILLGQWNVRIQLDGDVIVPPGTDDTPITPPDSPCNRGGFDAAELVDLAAFMAQGWSLTDNGGDFTGSTGLTVDPLDGVTPVLRIEIEVGGPLLPNPGIYYWQKTFAGPFASGKTYYTEMTFRRDVLNGDVSPFAGQSGYDLEDQSNPRGWWTEGESGYVTTVGQTIPGADASKYLRFGYYAMPNGEQFHHEIIYIKSLRIVEVGCAEDGGGPNPGGGGGGDPVPPPPPSSGLRALILWNYAQQYWFDYSPFNGVLLTPKAYTQAAMLQLLDACRAGGLVAVINLVLRNDAKVGGKFSQSAYLSCLNGYDGVDISGYTDVLAGLMVLDEPYLATPSGWGMIVQQSVVDGVLGKRAGELFPGYILYERTEATRMEASGRVFQYITGCWNVYRGLARAHMSVADYMRQQIASQSRIPTASGLGLAKRMWGLPNTGPGGSPQLTAAEYMSYGVPLGSDAGAEGLAVWADSNPPTPILRTAPYKAALGSIVTALG